MRKLINEFKTFINRGNVLDLAVGMIMGTAFTAIVSSVVNQVFKPLISWIPGVDNTGALQTVLRNAVLDEQGNVITEALILDWSAVISAVITFLLTAIILFIIVKLVNKAKEAKTEIKSNINKKKKKNKKEVQEVVEEVQEVPVVEEPKKPTTEELLEKIVSILEKENK